MLCAFCEFQWPSLWFSQNTISNWMIEAFCQTESDNRGGAGGKLCRVWDRLKAFAPRTSLMCSLEWCPVSVILSTHCQQLACICRCISLDSCPQFCMSRNTTDTLLWTILCIQLSSSFLRVLFAISTSRQN